MMAIRAGHSYVVNCATNHMDEHKLLTTLPPCFRLKNVSSSYQDISREG